jgi:F-type H+-transporting ATPase subunit a
MFLFAEGGEHVPLIAEYTNRYLGGPVCQAEEHALYPALDLALRPFGTDSLALFGKCNPESAIPWYTVMFVIACLLTIVVIWLFTRKLSEDDPTNGQLTLEAGFVALKDLIINVVGPHGYKYFPVAATFAVLILVSNLMGMFPLFMAPTASVSVTFALGITSFVYYNWVGVRENGLLGHLAHFAGPRLPLLMAILITPLIFGIELVSNMIRPLTLGIRLFANMFADEQIAATVAGLYPPYTQFLVPVILMPLALFVAFVQAFVFTLLSMIYLSEVSHGDHEHGHGHADEHHDAAHGERAAAHA